MPKTTEYFADTTNFGLNFDLISESLASMRVSGSLLLNEAYSPPWGVAIPSSTRLASLLGVGTGTRVVAFHLVEYGHCQIELPGKKKQLLTAGQVAICFGGVTHTLSEGNAKHQSIETLLAGGPNASRPNGREPTSPTSLLCGAFFLHHAEFNPLFVAMPDLLITSVSQAGNLHNLSGVARMLVEEMNRKAPASAYIIARLLEVFCAEAVRQYISKNDFQQAGWIKAINDPVIGRAITSIHSAPGRQWCVAQLAADAAMSPSRFAARFSATLGESPMAYVAKSRMNIARQKLASSRIAIDQVAAEVGYESLAAFNRAFKKLVGLPPAQWRTHELKKVRSPSPPST